MKTYLIFLILLFFSFPVYSQSIYLLDSMSWRLVELIPFFNSDSESEKYYYDEENRLIRKNFDNGYITYEYSEYETVEIEYKKETSTGDPVVQGKIVRKFNEDQYEISTTYFHYFLDFFEIQVDSIVRDEKNRMIEFFIHRWGTNWYLFGYETNEYVNDKLALSIYEEYDEEGNRVFLERFDYSYNDEGLVEEDKRYRLSDGGSSELINTYTYESGMVLEIQKDLYYNEVFSSSLIDKYAYDFPYVYLTYYNNMDSLVKLSRNRWMKYGTSQFYEYDTLLTNWSFGNLKTIVSNSEQYLENKNLLLTRNVNSTIDGLGEISDLEIRDLFYKEIEVDEVEPILQAFSIFPNPSSPGSIMSIKLENPIVQYDQIVFFNEVGQVVSRIPVSSESIIQFKVPPLFQGIYFIQLRGGKDSVSNTMKVVVK